MATKKDRGVPGNTVASQAEFDRMVYGYGKALMTLAHMCREYDDAGNTVKAIKFKTPKDEGGDWLAIVTVDLDGSAAVAFVFGDTLMTCVSSTAARIRNGSIQWKADQYA